MWRRAKAEEVQDQRELPLLLVSALDQLDGASLVIAPGEVAIFTNSEAEKLGILRDGRIQSEELLASIRVVRRTNIKQTGTIEIARGPIGEGKREITVKIIPLTENELVLVLLRDESEAQRVHDVRRDFVANISHELKTPIGALSLLSEAVLGAKDDSDAVSRFAARMQIEAKRLTDLVQEIIQLSRVQDSDPLKEAQLLSASDIIKEALDQCRTTADSRQITLTFQESEDGAILGDRDQLTMAIHNLIENAINYSPAETKVAVSTSIQDEIITISVADQGIGIPEAEVERIFERFYRVDPARSRETGGTGLGLSIVKHVITKHGGEISVWSSENVGSTFSIRLPIQSLKEDE
ncbi:BaeS Signal transduction histidine kinase [Candidatus Nanopelagicaceae bacterium]